MSQYINLRKIYVNYNLRQNLSKAFSKVDFALFVFLCVVFMFASSVSKTFSRSISFFFVDISTPITRFVSMPFVATYKTVVGIKELSIAQRENVKLKSENDKLKSLYAKAIAIRQENMELQNTLNFVSPRASNFTVARVVARTSETFNKSLVISVGKEKDVVEGSIVSGRIGVVGRISDVGDRQSRLTLVTDATSRIPIITLKSRIKGILSGSNSDLMRILYIPKNHQIEVGEWVFTSGDGDTLPPGLLVGVVKKIGKGYAAVEPAENMNNVNIVTIIKY